MEISFLELSYFIVKFKKKKKKKENILKVLYMVIQFYSGNFIQKSRILYI